MRVNGMKVFRILPDVNNYQSFLPENEKIWAMDILSMDSKDKSEKWQAPKIFILEPKLKRGNFFDLCPGGFVVDTLAKEKLFTFFEMGGELLPLEHNKKEFFLFNATVCINALDENKTEWEYGERTKAKIRIKKYAFNPSRFVETTLFKIPETAKGEILTLVGAKDPEDEFKYVVEQENLKGLIFQEIWSDE
jgi:hypothetical protein